MREGVQVKRLSVDEDTYVLTQSAARIDKERAMRRRRLGRYVQRLYALRGQVLTRYAQPEADHRMLLDLLRLKVPAQLQPKITAKLVKERKTAVPA